MLGIIGGSGLYRFGDDAATDLVEVATPFGPPSAPVRVVDLGGAKAAFLPRHGETHQFSPTTVPYRANFYALKSLGVDNVVAISAVGSLREALPPRSLVLPDQIIDRTVARPPTFFDRGVVAHVGLADPFCHRLRQQVAGAAAEEALPVSDGGTYLCIEGPQFSTRAESELYRSWGASVIGMTAMPEARLAREAELCFAVLALVTDYDVWHSREEDVSVEVVVGHLRANSAAALAIVRRLIESHRDDPACACHRALAGAFMTDLGSVGDDDRGRLGIIGERYLARGVGREQ